MVPIGQFAALTRLSLKALRLYDENGLLPPASVDPTTGYRSYRLEQVYHAQIIRLLRAVDMPLADIKAFFQLPDAAWRDRLDAYLADLQARQRERERILFYLRREFDPSPPDDEFGSHDGFAVTVKQLSAQPYVSRRETVGLDDLDPFIVESIVRLSVDHEAAGPPFAIFHGEIAEGSPGEIEVGLPTATLHAEGHTLPAGPVASTLTVGPQTDYPNILAAYDAVAIWIAQHGHQIAAPPREIYLTAPGSGETPRIEIAWPFR